MSGGREPEPAGVDAGVLIAMLVTGVACFVVGLVAGGYVAVPLVCGGAA